jgi:hypothetical protein
MSGQNVFYYSNYCAHCQKALNLLVKGGLTDEVRFLCIDKRGRDHITNQMYVVTDQGDKMLMPPNLHSVPALLLVNEQFRIIFGDEIAKYYEPRILNEKMAATQFNGEPMGMSLGNMGSNFGNGLGDSYSGQPQIITPPLDAKSDKIKGDDSVLSQYEMQRKAMDEQLGIGKQPPNPFLKPLNK